MSTPSSPHTPREVSKPAASRRPSARYGGTSAASAIGGVGGKILAVAIVVVVLLIAVAYGRNVMERRAVPVKAEFITQEAVDNETTRLWIDVTRKDPSVPSYCIVTALSYDFAEVGRREVAVPAGGEELTRIAVDLPVREPGVSGRVYGCSEDIPFYLDTSATHSEAR